MIKRKRFNQMALVDDIYKTSKYKMPFGSIAGASLMRHNITVQRSKRKGNVVLEKAALDVVALCIRLSKGAHQLVRQVRQEL
jgi:hypothetical protein